MAYFRVHVNLLAGHYHGQEWPPAPMRLFQALTAAGANAAILDEAAPALRWLEAMDAPRIVVPRCPPASQYTAFVPRNSDDITMRQLYKSDSPARTLADRRARYDGHSSCRRWVSGNISYEWKSDQPVPRELALLCDELTCLGRGEDLAFAWSDASDVPLDDDRERWSPQHGPVGAALRVPLSGSLASLEHRERARRERIEARQYPNAPTLFAERTYARANSALGRPIALFDLDFGERGAWHATRGKQVAAMVRHALDTHVAPEHRGYATGHADSADLDARLSWVPLPSLGHRHVDGRIRRLAILGPIGEALDSVRFRESVNAVRAVQLTADDGTQVVGLMRETDVLSGAIKPYFGESTTWHSVTPVILPGRTSRGGKQKGKFDRRKAEKLIVQAVQGAGLPLPIDFHYQTAPFERAGDRATAYQPLNRMEGFTRLHVKLTFAEPVAGPLVLGVGRHYGLGLFRAVSSA